jgi:hypothetical protein
MKNFLRRNFLIVFLAFLVVILFFLKKTYENKEGSEEIIKITPTVKIMPTIQVEPTIILIEDTSDPSDYPF